MVDCLLWTIQKISGYFSDSEQVKNLVVIFLTLHPYFLLTGCLSIQFFDPPPFFYHSQAAFVCLLLTVQRLYYIPDVMPRQRSLRLPTHLLPRVLRIWDSVFYSHLFFALHSFLLLSRPPWAPVYLRASCWSLKHQHRADYCVKWQQSTKEVYW